MMKRYHSYKYHNQKTIIDGNVFDSKKEARRYKILNILQEKGEIRDLQRQVPFVLIPQQREVTDRIITRGKNKGKPVMGKVIEREVRYIADFVYYDKDNNVVVEDTKGFRTKDYIIKRKLMLYVHNIRITEV